MRTRENQNEQVLSSCTHVELGGGGGGGAGAGAGGGGGGEGEAVVLRVPLIN